MSELIEKSGNGRFLDYNGERFDAKRSRFDPDWYMRVDDYPPLNIKWIRENLPGELEKIWNKKESNV